MCHLSAKASMPPKKGVARRLLDGLLSPLLGTTSVLTASSKCTWCSSSSLCRKALK